jgi:alpha-glucosidase
MIFEYDQRVPEEEWPNWVLGNHDQHRIATRIGESQARVAAMLLLTLRGTPTLYYGDEIGMHDVAVAPDRIQDPYEKNQPGLGLGRDPQRTPMQWDDSDYAGFSSTETWLPVADDFRSRNVKAMTPHARSILSLYRNLIALRRERKALNIGSYSKVRCAGNLMVYERRDGADRLLIALNFGHSEEAVALDGSARVLLSTHLDRADAAISGRCALRPDEGVILEIR